MKFRVLFQLIHCNLAASNVLVGVDMVCKVSDFGMSRDVMDNKGIHRSTSNVSRMIFLKKGICIRKTLKYED